MVQFLFTDYQQSLLYLSGSFFELICSRGTDIAGWSTILPHLFTNRSHITVEERCVDFIHYSNFVIASFLSRAQHIVAHWRIIEYRAIKTYQLSNKQNIIQTCSSENQSSWRITCLIQCMDVTFHVTVTRIRRGYYLYVPCEIILLIRANCGRL